MKLSIFLGAAIVASSAVQGGAQQAPAKWADTLSTEIERAQIAGDLSRIDAAAALATRVATAFPGDGLILHYQGYAIYRQAIVKMASGADASALFEQAASILERSLKTSPLPETHVLLASIDGQLIAKDPSRAMELGMASQASSSAATAIGAKNPRVWLLLGQGAMFTPPEYGGGLQAAKTDLERAIDLFATDKPKPGYPSWGRAEAYLWLGQVYEKSGDRTKAAAMYKQALDIAPGYAYAKSLAAGIK